MTTYSFNLAQGDSDLAKNNSIVLEDVDDVGKAPGVKIEFQFPPIVKSDKKDGKWELDYNAPGYEPKYRYQGANPRSISLEATYIVGGPPIQGGSGIPAIQRQLRIWKKYFYIKGIKIGKMLPIWRIANLGGVTGFIPNAGVGSAWRCINYNIKYSDEWVTQGGGAASHPLISTISVELQLATQVDITGQGDPKQPHENVGQFALSQWY